MTGKFVCMTQSPYHMRMGEGRRGGESAAKHSELPGLYHCAIYHCMVKLGGHFADLQASRKCLAGQVCVGVHSSVLLHNSAAAHFIALSMQMDGLKKE
eukprot:1161762-Pelagomonas_calceolata.AAC.16